jgi:hypothetical protein
MIDSSGRCEPGILPSTLRLTLSTTVNGALAENFEFVSSIGLKSLRRALVRKFARSKPSAFNNSAAA